MCMRGGGDFPLFPRSASPEVRLPFRKPSPIDNFPPLYPILSPDRVGGKRLRIFRRIPSGPSAPSDLLSIDGTIG